MLESFFRVTDRVIGVTTFILNSLGGTSRSFEGTLTVLPSESV